MSSARGGGGARDGLRELAELERVFKALAHPARRQILLGLHFRGGEMSSGAIADRFSCAWPTITRHLGVLREAELVSVAVRGRAHLYVLDRERLQRVVGDWLAWFDRPPGA